MRAPDVNGTAGWRAWRSPTRSAEAPASLATYLLHCPGAHFAWSYWWLGLVHLRELPGIPPAKLHFPEATHELMWAAINPEECPAPDPDAPPWPYLQPFDLIEQFQVQSDQHAAQIAYAVVRAIVFGYPVEITVAGATLRGRASPDQDFRGVWAKTIQATAKHHREGGHPTH